jgi:hypothetical protein
MRRAVGIGEVISVVHVHRPVIAFTGFNAGESAFLASERFDVAVRDIAPLSHDIGHKVDTIRAVAVIEAIHFNSAVLELKPRTELHIAKRIAFLRPFKRGFKNVPLLCCRCRFTHFSSRFLSQLKQSLCSITSFFLVRGESHRLLLY